VVYLQSALAGFTKYQVSNKLFEMNLAFPVCHFFLAKSDPKPKPKSKVALGFYPQASPLPGPTQCHFAQILA